MFQLYYRMFAVFFFLVLGVVGALSVVFCPSQPVWLGALVWALSWALAWGESVLLEEAEALAVRP